MTDFLTEAKQIVLELSLRAQGQESSERLVAETSKTLSGLALAAEVGADLEPELMRAAILTPSVVKDPQLCGQLTRALQDWLGPESVKNCRSLLGSEGFSRFSEVNPPIPVTLFFLGVTQIDFFAQGMGDSSRLPRLHTSTFEPAGDPALEVGLSCFAVASLELLYRSERLRLFKSRQARQIGIEIDGKTSVCLAMR